MKIFEEKIENSWTGAMQRATAILGAASAALVVGCMFLLLRSKKKKLCMLIRHAESMGNVVAVKNAKGGTVQQVPRDAPISPLGHEQCKQAKMFYVKNP